MRMAIAQANKAGAEGNEAAGSVIARGGSLVAQARNLVISSSDPTAHAEVVALREAGSALGQVDLSGCTLYTTFEPCPLCCGAILTSGITTLVMGARLRDATNRWHPYTVERLIDMVGWTDRIKVVEGVLSRECFQSWRRWQPNNRTGGPPG